MYLDSKLTAFMFYIQANKNMPQNRCFPEQDPKPLTFTTPESASPKSRPNCDKPKTALFPLLKHLWKAGKHCNCVCDHQQVINLSCALLFHPECIQKVCECQTRTFLCAVEGWFCRLQRPVGQEMCFLFVCIENTNGPDTFRHHENIIWFISA